MALHAAAHCTDLRKRERVTQMKHPVHVWVRKVAEKLALGTWLACRWTTRSVKPVGHSLGNQMGGLRLLLNTYQLQGARLERLCFHPRISETPPGCPEACRDAQRIAGPTSRQHHRIKVGFRRLAYT